MKPIYIFDLDGTLADASHRLHFIQGEKKDWRSFFAACANDKPILPTIRTFQELRREAEVWIWTGRSDEVKSQTIKWWIDNDCVPHEWSMRLAGDHRPDHEVKRGWLSAIGSDRDRIVAVFEDRDQVVRMWRECGLTCYQVAPGEF